MSDDEGKFRESIWSINPDWRFWFYVALSFCVFVVSVLTLVDEWSNGWLEIFDVLMEPHFVRLSSFGLCFK